MSTQVPAAYHEAITSKRGDLTTLPACFREFMSHFSPRTVLFAFTLALAARVYVGQWSWHDAVIPVVLIAAQPFVEWFIHKFLLHLKPLTIFGRRIDMYGAAQHRVHHKSPSDLNRVLLKPVEVLSFVVEIAILIPLVMLPITALTGGEMLPLSLTAVTLAFLGLFRYEWSHFLIHTPYVPKTKWYRTIWRNHRLHHFKHEDYWMGVTSNLGDRVLGTNPDQSTVPKSPTARTLGVDAG